MRVVIQRVTSARVLVDGIVVGEIHHGLLILLGIETRDTVDDVNFLAAKIAGLRVFKDEQGKMNLTLQQSGGQCLVVSQFTLHASTKKGNRPSFIAAARPEQAQPLYEIFLKQLSEASGQEVEHGEFGADMQVQLVNDGPVTIIVDSHNKE
jgi:D-aminoacyl-tRNA deacylase